MVLSGGLSNHSFEDLLQCLTLAKLRKAGTRAKIEAGWSDGRRKFGEVSTAIVSVLGRTDSEMSAGEIRVGVELILGSHVSRHSVSDYLITRSKGPKPLFIRTRHGHYRALV